MKISEIASLLNAQIWCGEDMLDREVRAGCACDMMSDVLAYGKDQAVLLTGLLNPQVVRTAEMMDIFCIVFVRGKQPTEAMIELARERSLALLTTNYPMFSACGILFSAGTPDGNCM
jgi:predicted transcriptional regulator